MLEKTGFAWSLGLMGEAHPRLVTILIDRRRNGWKWRLEPSSDLHSDRSRRGSAMTASAPMPSLSMLLAELVELGREAWRISERERAVRAEIEVLYETEEIE
jgi:hypothetical protein